jgi:GNAT superfamily N-acetyltransferase
MAASGGSSSIIVAHSRLAALPAPELARLAALPPHPVHAVAMRVLAERRRREREFHDDRIARLVTRTNELRGYLMYSRRGGAASSAATSIDYLYVARPGQGHGSGLLRWLEDRCWPEDDDSDVLLSVMSTIGAKPFYVKHGFQEDGAHALRLVKRLPRGGGGGGGCGGS